MISVDIVRPQAALDAPWRDLEPFARNAFQHPAALRAASESLLATIYVLLAWDISLEPARLVGFWALQAKQLLIWPYLDGSAFSYALMSLPMLHPDHAAKVMPAFLGAIAKDRALPNTILLRDLDAAGPEFLAFRNAVAGHSQVELRSDQRPIAMREAGLKRSGSTRKKLKQDWNRLAAAGLLEVENSREPGAVRAAFEDFLALEAKSWKGSNGTALLNDHRDAAFGRRMVGDLADVGKASVALLKLAGRPIAAQVLIYSANTAYTWKTSYDPAHAKHSPGTLLIDRISTELLDSGEVELMDSCARGDSFMAQLWSGRKPMVDIVTSAKPGFSASFLPLSLYFRGREATKGLRDRFLGGRFVRKGQARSALTPSEALSSPSASPGSSSPRPTADRSV